MSLISNKQRIEERPITYDNEIASKIQQRRYQILVHSLLYYELDLNIVSDHQWQAWGEELVELQNKYPEISEKVIFSNAFNGFDASSGFDLPYKDGQIIRAATRLIQYRLTQSNAQELQDALRKLQYQISSIPEEWDSYKVKQKHIENVKNKKEVKNIENKTNRKGLFSISRK